MKKPARSMTIRIGTDDASELESRRLLSADFVPDFAEVSKPEMPARMIEPSQVREVRIEQVSGKSDFSPLSKPPAYVSATSAFRGFRPEFAAFRQIQRGPDHFQTSLGDPFSVKFGSPMNGFGGNSAAESMPQDHAGSTGSTSSSPSDLDGSGFSWSALEIESSPSFHVILRPSTIGDEILSHALELAGGRLNSVLSESMPIRYLRDQSVDSFAHPAFSVGSIAALPAFIAVPQAFVSAAAIEDQVAVPVSVQSRNAMPAAIAEIAGPIQAGGPAALAEFRAGGRDAPGDSGEVPLTGRVDRSELTSRGLARELYETDAAPATEAEAKDDIWSRISDAFDLDESGFEPIGEPLDDCVEIDENELSAAVDRVLEGFAIPVEDTFTSPRIGTTIGLAAGTAITIRIVMLRRRDSEIRSGERRRAEDEPTTQVRPDLDASAAGS